MADYDFVEAARIINKLLASADDAAQRDPDALEHFRHAGELLMEAYPQVSHAEWPGWLKRHFNITATTAERYMARARPDPLADLLTKGGA